MKFFKRTKVNKALKILGFVAIVILIIYFTFLPIEISRKKPEKFTPSRYY